MKDEIKKLLEKLKIDGELITEDFLDEFKKLIDNAADLKVSKMKDKIKDDTEAETVNELAQLTEKVINNLDSYLDQVIVEWMDEHEKDFENLVASDFFSKIIDGVKGVFKEHNLDLPESEEEKTAFKELKGENETLKEEINGLKNTEIEKDEEILRLTLLNTWTHETKDMDDLRRGKLEEAMGEIDVDTPEQLTEKINFFREELFKDGKKPDDDKDKDDPSGEGEPKEPLDESSDYKKRWDSYGKQV